MPKYGNYNDPQPKDGFAQVENSKPDPKPEQLSDLSKRDPGAAKYRKPNDG
jgi:hypothetical protein